MVEKTSTRRAPWHLIPANNKPFGRLAAFRIIADRLSKGVPLEPRPLEPAVAEAAARGCSASGCRPTTSPISGTRATDVTSSGQSAGIKAF